MKEENNILVSFLEENINIFFSLLEENDKSIIENFYNIFMEEYHKTIWNIKTFKEIVEREEETYKRLININDTHPETHEQRKRKLEKSILGLLQEINRLKGYLEGECFYSQIKKVYNKIFDLLPEDKRVIFISLLNKKEVDIEKLFL